MKFIKPIDGDVLFSVADGTATEEGLWASVSLSAAPGHHLEINGTAATEENGIYTATVLLDAYRNRIEARNAGAYAYLL